MSRPTFTVVYYLLFFMWLCCCFLLLQRLHVSFVFTFLYADGNDKGGLLQTSEEHSSLIDWRRTDPILTLLNQRYPLITSFQSLSGLQAEVWGLNYFNIRCVIQFVKVSISFGTSLHRKLFEAVITYKHITTARRIITHYDPCTKSDWKLWRSMI